MDAVVSQKAAARCLRFQTAQRRAKWHAVGASGQEVVKTSRNIAVGRTVVVFVVALCDEEVYGGEKGGGVAWVLTRSFDARDASSPEGEESGRRKQEKRNKRQELRAKKKQIKNQNKKTTTSARKGRASKQQTSKQDKDPKKKN